MPYLAGGDTPAGHTLGNQTYLFRILEELYNTLDRATREIFCRECMKCGVSIKRAIALIMLPSVVDDLRKSARLGRVRNDVQKSGSASLLTSFASIRDVDLLAEMLDIYTGSTYYPRPRASKGGELTKLFLYFYQNSLFELADCVYLVSKYEGDIINIISTPEQFEYFRAKREITTNELARVVTSSRLKSGDWISVIRMLLDRYKETGTTITPGVRASISSLSISIDRIMIPPSSGIRGAKLLVEYGIKPTTPFGWRTVSPGSIPTSDYRWCLENGIPVSISVLMPHPTMDDGRTVADRFGKIYTSMNWSLMLEYAGSKLIYGSGLTLNRYMTVGLRYDNESMIDHVLEKWRASQSGTDKITYRIFCRCVRTGIKYGSVRALERLLTFHSLIVEKIDAKEVDKIYLRLKKSIENFASRPDNDLLAHTITKIPALTDALVSAGILTSSTRLKVAFLLVSEVTRSPPYEWARDHIRRSME